VTGGLHAPCTSKSLPQREAQAGRTDVKGTITPSAAWVCVLVRRGRERTARRKGVVCVLENIFFFFCVGLRIGLGERKSIRLNRVESRCKRGRFQLVTASIPHVELVFRDCRKTESRQMISLNFCQIVFGVFKVFRVSRFISHELNFPNRIEDRIARVIIFFLSFLPSGLGNLHRMNE
jgi:hypothetical protein